LSAAFAKNEYLSRSEYARFSVYGTQSVPLRIRHLALSSYEP
jgi:hypothetical protein